MKTRTAASTPRSAGITLTEILISILILGVGLVSLATLFPIGLLRLREAQRQTRSAYLFQSATADTAARGLLNTNSFAYADLTNQQFGLNPWFPNAANPALPNGFDPLIQDAGFYGLNTYGPYMPYVASNPSPSQGVSTGSSGGYGLPFAYDPLWRYWTSPVQTNPPTGTYLYDNSRVWASYPNQVAPEARFASGINSMRWESDQNPASAHGLQRLTNFNRPRIMPVANTVPSIFVSPEDVAWQEPTTPNYAVAFSVSPAYPRGYPVGTPSTVVPDLSIALNSLGQPTYQPTNDWRFSWMITAQQTNPSNGASFEGNIVVFENRQFAIDPTTNQAAGETVYEGVFGFSSNVQPVGGPGYGAGADRTVLIRWLASQPDPVVKVGDWIADVTYERSQMLVYSRFYSNNGAGWPNPLDNQEWDNLPAQRCFWYQVQKVTPAQTDPNPNLPGGPYRSMVVYVNQKLDAKTLLQSDGHGTPVWQNAVLVCPYVVNVIPQTFFVR
jgi:type II secretory pathway pseudopilin PulG